MIIVKNVGYLTDSELTDKVNNSYFIRLLGTGRGRMIQISTNLQFYKFLIYILFFSHDVTAGLPVQQM